MKNIGTGWRGSGRALLTPLACGLAVLLNPDPALATEVHVADSAGITAALAILVGICVASAGWLMVRRQTDMALNNRLLADSLRQTELMLSRAPMGWIAWTSSGLEVRSPHLAEWFGAAAEGGVCGLGEELDPECYDRLSAAAEDLRREDRPRALTVTSRDGARTYEVRGEILDSIDPDALRHVLWFRDVSEDAAIIAELEDEVGVRAAERDRLAGALDSLTIPVWLRDRELGVVWVNQAYAAAAEADREALLATARGGGEAVPDIYSARALAERAAASGEAQAERRSIVMSKDLRAMNVAEAPMPEGAGLAGHAQDLTEIEDTRAALRRYVEAHEDVLENLATPIAIFGADRRLKLFNSAYSGLWRLNEDWLSSQPDCGEVLEQLREARRLEEQIDFQSYKKSMLDLFTSIIEPYEEVMHLPDGTTLRVRISPHPLGGLLFLYQDITDRLELERTRNTLVAVQAASLNNLRDGVAVFGADGKLKLANPAFSDIWSLSPERLIDEPHIGDLTKALRHFFASDLEWIAWRQEVIGWIGERQMKSLRIERNDDTIIELAAVPLPDGNLLLVSQDMTDTIHVERALRERAEALEAADQLKTQFVASVSYELRTPLNTIIGFTEILDNGYIGDLSERQCEYIRGILEASHHLLELVNDILDLASIEAGRMVLDLKSFDLCAALRTVPPMFGDSHFHRNVEVEFDCALDLGNVVADERRVRQVVFNLLNNAIDSSEPGGVVRLGARRAGDEIEICVTDNGPGVGLEEQGDIFERFHAIGLHSRPTPGGGLGLSLAKQLVELHGGRIEHDWEPGVETRVTFFLPTMQADARAIERAVAQA